MPTAKPNTVPLPAGFAGFKFSNGYARLPEHFYVRVNPTPVAQPALIKVNHPLARKLGLCPDKLESPAGVAVLSGNAIPPGAEPLAQAYAGHQFGSFNPQLGDGRAVLLGEVIDDEGRPQDIQLKGAGPTPFSRSGDGRAAIGPVVREYIVSEAMHTLGIKTTRALAAVATGENVYRQNVLPGAVLTRVASSHIRIGTFEYFRSQGDQAAIKQLADFTIQRHYPDAAQSSNPYLALLKAVLEAQAALVASWLHVGFIHGVMNTDNTSLSGETIDYGPCAFMDRYDPATVFSSIDRQGRYAYGNQSRIALWNLSRLAECLLPLLDENMDQAVAQAEELLGTFAEVFTRFWQYGMHNKIGLFTKKEEDEVLIQTLLQLMQRHQVDFTQSFRYLADYLDSGFPPDHKFIALFKKTDQAGADEQGIYDWLTQWQNRLAKDETTPSVRAAKMRKINPLYIPRNHLVEAAISAAEQADYSLVEEMIQVLNNPYEEQAGMERYAEPAAPTDEAYQTFCGT